LGFILIAMNRIVVVIIILLIILGYFYFSRPDEIAVTDKGRAEGIINKTRALLQGKKFWKYQLELADEAFVKNQAPQLPSSAEMQELYKRMRDAQRALDEMMKTLFSREESMAIRLRTEADSLERAAKWRQIDDVAEAARMKEQEKLKTIIPLIEKKLNITKTK
jgi:hypothetical protein